MHKPLVIHDFLNSQQVDHLRTVLAAVPFVDGKHSAGPLARGVKSNKQAEGNAIETIASQLVDILFRNKEIGRTVYPHRTTRPLFNRYDEGDHYGHHEDNPLQSGLRSDISYTVFLSGLSEYEGGALVIDGEPHRHPAGSIVLYAAGTPHQVNKVTTGTRHAAVGWIQSVVRNPERRALLRTFSQGLDEVRKRAGGEGADTHALNHVRNQLMRMWAEI